MRNFSTKKKIELIAKAALAKKANDVVLVDLRKLSAVCDYFIIASGNSTIQIDAIAGNIEKELLGYSCKLWHKEGRGEALWILLDYGDIVVHVFYKDARGFYNLEKLWHDAPQKTLRDPTFRKRRSHPAKRKRERRKRGRPPLL